MTKTQKNILNLMANNWILNRPTLQNSDGWIQEIGGATKIKVSKSNFKSLSSFITVESINSKSVAKYLLI